VLMEANVWWPPPIRFAIMDAPGYDSENRGFMYGCSVAYQADLLRAHGYALLQLDWNNALYVRERDLPAFKDGLLPAQNDAVCTHYMRGFAERQGVYHKFFFWSPEHLAGKQPPNAPFVGATHREASQWAVPRLMASARRSIQTHTAQYAGRSFVLAGTPTYTPEARANVTWMLTPKGTWRRQGKNEGDAEGAYGLPRGLRKHAAAGVAGAAFRPNVRHAAKRARTASSTRPSKEHMKGWLARMFG
jgi:hypothetical protein